jgi:hypothetical protein
MATEIEFRDDDFEGGTVVIEDIKDAKILTGILQSNGYAVNLRGRGSI